MTAKRTALVNEIHSSSVLFSSLINIGDTNYLAPFSRVFALQREVPYFFGDEGSLKSFPMFSTPSLEANLYEKVNFKTQNACPFIKVGKLEVIGVSAAGSIQIGNVDQFRGEARIKHIRHYIPEAR